jgi:hypothetical protein
MVGSRRIELSASSGYDDPEVLKFAWPLCSSASPGPLKSISAYRQKLLPLAPVWPGFAINTIFYAAILWVLFFALGAVRRSIRHQAQFESGVCISNRHKRSLYRMRFLFVNQLIPRTAR